MTHDDQAVRRRLASMIGRGVQFAVSDGKLRRRGALEPDELAWLSANKETIIAILTGPDLSIGDEPWWDDPGICDTPLLWIPPQHTCHAPRACGRLGPCAFYVPGQSCDQRLQRKEAA